MTVAVAMSGGVDSSVAAALLREQGCKVIGVTMNVWQDGAGSERSGGCCGAGAIEDARRVAHRLGIPHYVLDFRELFREHVMEDFYREYRRGRTPNPCIRCNRHIKFDALMRKAESFGAGRLATGHYARIEEEGGRWLLKKGMDARKDQSYFLYTLTQEQLARTLMPVGSLIKYKVREIARELGLPVADKKESTDICFITDGSYAGHFAAESGPILDTEGRVVGRHRGIASYTIGQRRGLGIAAAEPLYVTAISPERNAVCVGSREAIYSRELVASDLSWVAAGLIEPTRVRAKIRYRHPDAEATVTPLEGGCVHVKFEEPQMAVTPGQAVVFYRGDVVIGGGTIEKAG